MTVVSFKSKAQMGKELLDACSSFELRGPRAAALISIQGANVEVLRQNNDWGKVVGDRPLVDNRTDKVSDLIPSARARMEEIFQGLGDKVRAAGSDLRAVAPKGPGTR